MLCIVFVILKKRTLKMRQKFLILKAFSIQSLSLRFVESEAECLYIKVTVKLEILQLFQACKIRLLKVFFM